jgi:hypothetical protein
MTDVFDHLKLSKADAEMLDQLVDVGFDIDQLEYLTAEEKQRANSILKMLGFLDVYPVEDASETLIDATLARIDQYENNRSSRMHISTAEVKTTSRGFLFPKLDLLATAAAVLLCVALVSMFVKSNHDISIHQQCATNMAGVGNGLFTYAQDHNGEMPTSTVASLGSLFDDIIPERTDAEVLVEEGYCDHHHLNCPGHGGAGGGFSYQTQSADSWNHLKSRGRIFVIMADRNPILDDLLAGGTPDPLTPSANHGTLGQNRLHDDGSTYTTVAPPIIGNDFIWRLDGKNLHFDIFLTH